MLVMLAILSNSSSENWYSLNIRSAKDPYLILNNKIKLINLELTCKKKEN